MSFNSQKYEIKSALTIAKGNLPEKSIRKHKKPKINSKFVISLRKLQNSEIFRPKTAYKKIIH